MSETGIISQEYQNAADLFRDINRAVVILKKRYFKLSGASQITEQESSDSRRLLVSVLRQLVAKLGKESSPMEEKQETTQIPPFFLKRLYQRNQGTISWYVEDLEELCSVLDKDRQLTEEMIKQLDELCGQLDAETTSIYRKLWRK
jgi:uncharacterized coiled-coil protein SlyX